MKISDLLHESQQINELTASDVGRGIGKVAKGVGAVAGGIAGIPSAVKKGFQAGKQTVSGAADAKTAAPAAQTQVKPAVEPEQTSAVSAASAAKEPAAAPEGSDVETVKKELAAFLQTYKDDVAMQNKNWELVMPKVTALEKQVADLTAQKSKGSDSKEPSPSQAEIDATQKRLGVGQFSDSVVRKASAVNESIQLYRR